MIRKFIYFIAIISILICNESKAAFIFQYSFLYHSWEDDNQNFSYSRMDNHIFAGASIGRGTKFYLGPSYCMWSKTHQASSTATESEVSFTEFGATFIAYFDEARRWKIELTYNPSVKGERDVSGSSEELDGTGYKLSFGYQLPVNKNFALGASLNYHVASISSKVVGTTETDVSETYTTIVPLFELSFRFF